MSTKKNILLWITAIALACILMIYQRQTGPTYPVSIDKEIAGETVEMKLPRTHGGDGSEIIEILMKNQQVSGRMQMKRYPSRDDWTDYPLTRTGDLLTADIPHQPPAGKMTYRIWLTDGNTEVALTDEPLIIRFKGAVPQIWLILHLIGIIIGFVFSMRAGLEAIVKGDRMMRYSLIAFIFLILGGFWFGPVMQKYAFGAYWTGWPFGHDLTDNKMLAAIVAWGFTLWRLRKNPNATKAVLVAVGVLIVVFLIPHSVLGSEIDYTKLPE